MMGFMIYFVINIRFLKSGPSLEKWGKNGENGEKSLSQNPHFHTTIPLPLYHTIPTFNDPEKETF